MHPNGHPDPQAAVFRSLRRRDLLVTFLPQRWLETSDLAKAVRAFKGVSAAHARPLGIRNLWQRDYYDHILRSSENFHSVAAYIFENPVRAGLVNDPHDWLFSGSFVFDWKNLALPVPSFTPKWKGPV